MRIRKLLQKAREQNSWRVISQDPYVRSDGLQWVVEEITAIVSYSATYKPLAVISRFRTRDEAEEYVKTQYWKCVSYNIKQLRKKYNKPSKKTNYEEKGH